ncbi:MAG: hypothetical protein OGM67_07240 [Oscillospiraceae bacterium]|nr:MAG: hypothetical protein OGM67_07240 [Oscillospiraceae bacterium]
MYGRTPPDLLQSESETTPLLLQLWQSINHEYAAESTLKELRTAITYIKNMCLTDAELDGPMPSLTSWRRTLKICRSCTALTSRRSRRGTRWTTMTSSALRCRF